VGSDDSIVYFELVGEVSELPHVAAAFDAARTAAE
jgi:hypothetical protein